MPFANGSADGPQYYSYDAGPAHVVVLNAFGIYAAGFPQYAWLQADLAAINYTATPWVIAVLHTPWYCSNTAHQGSGDLMALTMEAMFVAARVSLVIAGHVSGGGAQNGGVQDLPSVAGCQQLRHLTSWD